MKEFIGYERDELHVNEKVLEIIHDRHFDFEDNLEFRKMA